MLIQSLSRMQMEYIKTKQKKACFLICWNMEKNPTAWVVWRRGLAAINKGTLMVSGLQTTHTAITKLGKKRVL